MTTGSKAYTMKCHFMPRCILNHQYSHFGTYRHLKFVAYNWKMHQKFESATIGGGKKVSEPKRKGKKWNIVLFGPGGGSEVIMPWSLLNQHFSSIFLLLQEGDIRAGETREWRKIYCLVCHNIPPTYASEIPYLSNGICDYSNLRKSAGWI